MSWRDLTIHHWMKIGSGSCLFNTGHPGGVVWWVPPGQFSVWAKHAISSPHATSRIVRDSCLTNFQPRIHRVINPARNQLAWRFIDFLSSSRFLCLIGLILWPMDCIKINENCSNLPEKTVICIVWYNMLFYARGFKGTSVTDFNLNLVDWCSKHITLVFFFKYWLFILAHINNTNIVDWQYFQGLIKQYKGRKWMQSWRQKGFL